MEPLGRHSHAESSAGKSTRRPAAASAPTPVPAPASSPASTQTVIVETTLAHDVGHLLLKIGIVVAIIAAVFAFIFGLWRCDSASMQPNVKDGDLVFYYRLDKSYVANDVIMFTYDGQTQAGRVVAVAGDTVDITADGLLINGNLQSAQGVTEKTKRYAEGVSFPLTVGSGQVFVLGDAREHSTDSRIFGSIDTDDTSGQVVGLIRRRSL